MSEGHPVPEILKRRSNFSYTKHNILDSLSDSDYQVWAVFQEQLDEVRAEAQEMKKKGKSGSAILRAAFGNVYELWTMLHSYQMFLQQGDDDPFYFDCFYACYFTCLCEFLFETTRLKGKSLRRQIYDNDDSMKYNVEGSPNYYNHENTTRDASPPTILSQDAAARQRRSRKFKNAKAHHSRKGVHPLRYVCVHEWKLDFVLEKDKEIRATFNDLRLLNGNLESKLKDPVDPEKLKEAYKRYLNKLKKIKCENLTVLYDLFFKHLDEDRTFYGINLYRFEKELRFYLTIDEIQRFLKCKTKKEQNRFLVDMSAVEDIWFPKVNKQFWKIPLAQRKTYATLYMILMEDTVNTSLLFFDQLIDDGIFGDDWENLFTETINSLAPSVFYDPKTLKWPQTPDLQDVFMKVISTPAFIRTWDKYAQLVPKYSSERERRLREPLRYLLTPLK